MQNIPIPALMIATVLICHAFVFSATLKAQTLTVDAKPDPIAINNEGVRLTKLKKFGEALRLFEQVIEITPKDPVVYYNAGVAYFEDAKYDMALGVLNQALLLRPNYGDALNQLGLVYAELGQLDLAIPAFEHALRTAAKADLVVMFNLGCMYNRVNKFEEAIGVLEQANRFDASNPEILFNLGYAYGRTGSYSKAIGALRRVVELKPDDSQSRFLLGSLYMHTKNKAAALGEYSRIKSLDPRLASQLFSRIYGDKILALQPK